MASQFDMDVEVAETPTHKRSRRYEDEKMDVDAEEHVRVVPLVYPNNCTWDAASGVLRSIPGEERRSLAVNPEALEFLRSLNPSRKLGTISICGPARTGKSLVAGECVAPGVVPCPFALGHTMNACTYGIWIGLRAVSSSSSPGEEMDILVMDVEGTGFHQSDAHADYQLMVCALLLSSTLVYNSKGVFDKDSIDKIQFVGDLVNHIRLPEDSEAVASIFPRFLWVLRDAHLHAEVNGQRTTLREYFEKVVLNPPFGFDERTIRKQQISRVFLSLFQQYDVMAFPPPHSDSEVIQHIEYIPLSELQPQFISQMDEFRLLTLRNVTPKPICFDGKTSIQPTSDSMVTWIRYVVDAVNRGVPDVQSLSHSVSQHIFRDQMEKIVVRYRDACHTMCTIKKMSIHPKPRPLTMREVGECFENAAVEIRGLLDEVGDEHMETLLTRMHRIREDITRDMEHDVETFCQQWCETEYAIIRVLTESPENSEDTIRESFQVLRVQLVSLEFSEEIVEPHLQRLQEMFDRDLGLFQQLRARHQENVYLRDRQEVLAGELEYQQREVDRVQGESAATIAHLNEVLAKEREDRQREQERHRREMQNLNNRYDQL